MGSSFEDIQEQLEDEGHPTKKRRIDIYSDPPISMLPHELLLEILRLTNSTFPELIILGNVSKLWHSITREPAILKPVLANLSEEKIESLLFKITEPEIQTIILNQFSKEKIASLFEKTAKGFEEIVAIHAEELHEDNEEFQIKVSNFYSETVPKLQKKIEVLLLDRRITINTKFGAEQETLCHLAAKLNLEEIIKWLHKKSADLNATNINEETPLHIACENLSITGDFIDLETIRLLLEYKAYVNSTDKLGTTALHHLARFQFLDQLSNEGQRDFKNLLNELYEKGANFLAKEPLIGHIIGTGLAPWQLAASAGNLKINLWLNELTQKQIEKEQQQQDDAIFQELETADLLNGLKSNF